jgi:hypothetical protein
MAQKFDFETEFEGEFDASDPEEEAVAQAPAPRPPQNRVPAQQPQYQDEVDEVAADFQESEVAQEQLSEVERRLEMAHYYRMMLNQDLFENATSIGVAVEKEIRDYIMSRLEILMGVKAEQAFVAQQDPALVFLPEEVEVLKAIAAKVRGKPAILAPKPAASVRPVSVQQPASTPKAPAVRPVSVQGRGSRPAPAPGIKTVGRKLQRGGLDGRAHKTGKVFSEELGKEVTQDLTDQVRPSMYGAQPIPMPVGKQAIEAAYATKAYETQALAGTGQSNLLKSAIGIALHSDNE